MIHQANSISITQLSARCDVSCCLLNVELPGKRFRANQKPSVYHRHKIFQNQIRSGGGLGIFLIDRHSAVEDNERRDQSPLLRPTQKSGALGIVCLNAAVLHFHFCRQEGMLGSIFKRHSYIKGTFWGKKGFFCRCISLNRGEAVCSWDNRAALYHCHGSLYVVE